MTSPNPSRPGSAAAGFYPSSIPPSPRPSVAGRTSRSSLRREIDPQDPALVPRPASVVAAHPLGATPDEQHHRSPPSPSPLAAQPAIPDKPVFSPLFALLTSTSHSSNQQTIHHPTVRYIFEDDDPEFLTAELAQHHGDYPQEGEDPEANNDRAVILDLERTTDGSGFEVAWASSLSPDWAVTSANVGTMEGGVGGSGGALVLKIEGVSLDPSSSGAPTGQTGHSPESSAGSGERQAQQRPESNREEYDGLIQDFEKRMSVLRKVAEAGAERQRLLREQEAMAAETSAAHYFHGAAGVAPPNEKKTP
ncbi:hypothetical protein QBC43DRAFT_321717 [Cladorrhinum sp. PSN259]|nr:hypothetical protein QBC43DRAFT_321717 [Cladorrhinum sp. PSN259]